MDHKDDLIMVMSPSGICSVCEHVVSGYHRTQCTVRMLHIQIAARSLE